MTVMVEWLCILEDFEFSSGLMLKEIAEIFLSSETECTITTVKKRSCFRKVLQSCVKVCSKFWKKLTPTLGSLPQASDEDGDSAELYILKRTTLIPPSTLLINHHELGWGGCWHLQRHQQWILISRKLFFALWVILHLYPFLKGLLGHQKQTLTFQILTLVGLCRPIYYKNNE